MKKPSYVPVLIFMTAIVLVGLSDVVDNFSLHVMLGATGKIFLIVSVIGIWKLTFLPLMAKHDNSK